MVMQKVMYNPAGKVTKEQLATFLVRVLGKDAEAKAKQVQTQQFLVGHKVM